MTRVHTSVWRLSWSCEGAGTDRRGAGAGEDMVSPWPGTGVLSSGAAGPRAPRLELETASRTLLPANTRLNHEAALAAWAAPHPYRGCSSFSRTSPGGVSQCAPLQNPKDTRKSLRSSMSRSLRNGWTQVVQT